MKNAQKVTDKEIVANAVAAVRAFPEEHPAVAYGHEACVRNQIAAYLNR